MLLSEVNMPYLVHFNPYHNPKNGQFAPAKSGKIYATLDKTSDDKLYKTLRKEIRNTRKEKWGWSNQWMSRLPIGPKSEALVYDREKKEKAYRNTPEYKEFEKRIRKLENKYYDQDGTWKDDDDDGTKLDKEWEKLMSEAPKRDFNTLNYAAKVDKYGYKFLDDFAKKGGRDLSIAYLEDMGYSSEKAQEYVDRLAKYDWSLGGY